MGRVATPTRVAIRSYSVFTAIRILLASKPGRLRSWRPSCGLGWLPRDAAPFTFHPRI